MFTFNEQATPPKPGPSLPIIRVTDKVKHIFTVYSETVWGVWTHWNGRASDPCLLPVETCPGHKRQHPLRWKGYLHCFDHNERQQAYLELTPAGVKMLESQLASQEILRGLLLTVERSQGGPKGRLLISVTPNRHPLEKLTAERHPRFALAALWGLNISEDSEALNVSA